MEKNSFGDSLPGSDKIHRKFRLSLSGGAPVRLTFTELELYNLNIGQQSTFKTLEGSSSFSLMQKTEERLMNAAVEQN